MILPCLLNFFGFIKQKKNLILINEVFLIFTSKITFQKQLILLRNVQLQQCDHDSIYNE